ncbi:MAG TPA: hypothetical protein VMS89_02515 [Methanoregulaceae archaeon]|nr:hypothetical protein [Methanoregulaceae archaeon]
MISLPDIRQDDSGEGISQKNQACHDRVATAAGGAPGGIGFSEPF